MEFFKNIDFPCFIEMLLRHMDEVLQTPWLSMSFIRILLRHMDGHFQKPRFSSGFLYMFEIMSSTYTVITDISERHVDGVIQK